MKRFPISLKEAKALFKHLRRAWRYEELVPQPEGYILIPTRRIRVPKDAIRKDLGELEELKRSIEREGVLQPIVVRPLNSKWKQFEPVVGLRRFSACKVLGIGRIPACIRDFGGERVAALALEENRHRKDLTQPELLEAILRLREKGYSLDKIAEISGLNKAEVSAYVRTPELPQEVRKAFFAGEISFSHLRVLIGLPEKQARELLKRIKAEGLSGSDAQVVASAMKEKLVLPDFFKPEEFFRFLGKHLEFRRGKRSVRLAIQASGAREMAEILGKILKVKKLK